MNPHAYRFGRFRLDPARRVLLRDGAATTLPPKAFDVLVYLLEQRERAVGRDELIAAVWGKLDITDNALGQVVLQARRALDDSGEGGQRLIVTVPRFGYRWAGRLEREETSEEGATQEIAEAIGADLPGPSKPLTPRPTALPPWRKRLLAMAIAAATIGLVFALWRDYRGAGGQRPAASATSASSPLIVLPATVDAPAAAAWVRLGIMDLVAQDLRAAGRWSCRATTWSDSPTASPTAKARWTRQP